MQQQTAAPDIEHSESRQLRRKAHRVAFSGKAVVSSDFGDRLTAPMRNISPFGCNIECAADWLRTGRFVTLHISANRAIQAIVRWARGGSVGLEFLRPIDLLEAEWLDSPGI